MTEQTRDKIVPEHKPDVVTASVPVSKKSVDDATLQIKIPPLVAKTVAPEKKKSVVAEVSVDVQKEVLGTTAGVTLKSETSHTAAAAAENNESEIDWNLFPLPDGEGWERRTDKKTSRVRTRNGFNCFVFISF